MLLSGLHNRADAGSLSTHARASWPSQVSSQRPQAEGWRAGRRSRLSPWCFSDVHTRVSWSSTDDEGEDKQPAWILHAACNTLREIVSERVFAMNTRGKSRDRDQRAQALCYVNSDTKKA